MKRADDSDLKTNLLLCAFRVDRLRKTSRSKTATSMYVYEPQSLENICPDEPRIIPQGALNKVNQRRKCGNLLFTFRFRGKEEIVTCEARASGIPRVTTILFSKLLDLCLPT